jgi:hypothetical protein
MRNAKTGPPSHSNVVCPGRRADHPVARLRRRSPAGLMRALDPRRLHAPQLVLQVAYLVPDARGQLELKLGRRRVHLLG